MNSDEQKAEDEDDQDRTEYDTTGSLIRTARSEGESMIAAIGR